MNCEEYRALLSAGIQPNTAKLIGQRFTVQTNNDPMHTAKATQDSRQIKTYSKRSLPKRACFSVTEDKTEGREMHKQAETECGCLPEHVKGNNTAFGDVHGFYTGWPDPNKTNMGQRLYLSGQSGTHQQCSEVCFLT